MITEVLSSHENIPLNSNVIRKKFPLGLHGDSWNFIFRYADFGAIYISPTFYSTKKISILLFILSLALVVSDIKKPGITQDEIWYFKAGKSYTDWFCTLGKSVFEGRVVYPFKKEIIREYWSLNKEHPPLSKILSGTTHKVFSPLIGNISAYRLSSALLFSLLVVIIYVFMSSSYNQKVGIFSALSFLLMPRVLGHAHLATLDLPTAFFWFVSSITFLKGISNVKWAFAFGIVFGFALLVRMSSVFVIFPLVLWGILYHKWKIRNNVLCAGFISPAIFFIFWPLLWHEPMEHLLYCYNYWLKHWKIPVYYFGKIYIGEIPFHYPFVFSIVTIPTGIAIMSVVGILKIVRNIIKDKIGVFLLLQMSFPLILAILFPLLSTDGERHFLQAFPFFACMSGIGLYYVVSIFEKELQSQKSKVKIITLYFIVIITFADAIVSVAKIRPYYLCFYNEFVGGISGAHTKGLETAYWMDVITDDVLAHLNKYASHSAKIGFYPTASEPVLKFYQKEKMLRDDLQFIISGLNQCIITKDMEYLVGISRQSSFSNLGWEVYKHMPFEFEIEMDKVPIVRIYKLK